MTGTLLRPKHEPRTVERAPYLRGVSCRLVFQMYLVCVSTCFFISTFYHVFRNYSVNAYANWLIADINGVGLYIFGSVLLVAYFRFRCEDAFRWIYMVHSIR